MFLKILNRQSRRKACSSTFLYRLGVVLCLLAPTWPTVAEPLPEATGIQTARAESPTGQDPASATAQKLLDEYRTHFQERESLRQYNQHLEKMIATQETAIKAAENGLKKDPLTAGDLVPVMTRMLASLKQFIAMDLPFLHEERAARVTQLDKMLDDPEVALEEKYRRILDAYFTEVDYGRTVDTYQATLPIEGTELTVDFLRIGRIALLYRTPDGARAGFWDKATSSWQPLPADYRGSFEQGLRLARKQSAPDLLKIPVPAPESLP